MNKYRILLIDDDESVLRILQTSLRYLEPIVETHITTNGAEAILYCRLNNYQMVITDFFMTGIDGLEIVSTVKKLQPEATIVMMTAYGIAELEDEASRLGIDQFLRKPVEIQQFRNIVWQAVNAERILD